MFSRAAIAILQDVRGDCASQSPPTAYHLSRRVERVCGSAITRVGLTNNVSPKLKTPPSESSGNTVTAGQFAIFDSMLPAIGIDKFHYHEPHAEH